MDTPEDRLEKIHKKFLSDLQTSVENQMEASTAIDKRFIDNMKSIFTGKLRAHPQQCQEIRKMRAHYQDDVNRSTIAITNTPIKLYADENELRSSELF